MVRKMCVGLSKLTIILIVTAVAAIAAIIGLTLGLLLHPCRIVAHPENLTVTTDGSLVYLVWVNPEENGDCSVTYAIQYKINIERTQEVITSEPFYSLVIEDICFELLVNIWTVGHFGRKSDNHITVYYTPHPIDPDNIPAPMGLRFIPKDEGIELSWTRPTELQRCWNLQYNIRIIPDSLTNREISTNTENNTIPRNWFCLSMNISITSIIGDTVGPEVEAQYTEVLSPPRVSVLIINYPENTFTIMWTRNVVQFECGFDYKVIYSLLDSEERTYRTWEPSITFDIAYCNTARLVFYTIGRDVQSVGNAMTRTEGLPSRVEPVQNFRIDDVSVNEARALWDSPRFVESCTDIIYTVTATNEAANTTSTCTGNSECQIAVEDFCPVTNFTVQATSIRGDQTWEIYECPSENDNM